MSSQLVKKTKRLRTQLENLPEISGQGELLDVPFIDWCKSLQIKTDKGAVPFELFDWQESFAELITGESALIRRPIALLSSRQTGKTSLLLALASYLAQARRQFTCVVIHRTTSDAYLLCKRLKRTLSGVPLKTENLSLLEFANTDSMIHFRSSNPGANDGAEQVGRGLESVDLVIVEEASHTANLKEVIGVIAPALTWSNMGVVCFVGTAGSKLSYYYESLCKSAGSADRLERTLKAVRKSAIAPFQVLDNGEGPVGVITNWRAIDKFKNEPDFIGRVQKEFNLSDEQIASEYELIFGSGGDASVFDFQLVQSAAIGELDGDEINKGGIFFAGVDPAAQGGDYTVCIVLEDVRGKLRVAQMYRKKKGTSEQHLACISDLLAAYNPLVTLVESNSIGALYLENLASVNNRLVVEGHHTSQQSKEVLIGKINLALEQRSIAFPAGPIREELLSFRRTGANMQKLEAAQGANDDTVIALGLALSAAKFGKQTVKAHAYR